MNGEKVLHLVQRLQAAGLTRLLRSSFRRIGRTTTLGHPLRLHGAAHIAIGDHVFVGPGSWLQALRRPGSPEPDGPVISIADGVVFSGAVHISAVEYVEIGEGTGVARGVFISDHTHVRAAAGRPVDEGISASRPVRIGRGCWLGQNVVVSPGVTIGDWTTVGANSIVVRDLPSGVVATGLPARVARSQTSIPDQVTR